MQLYLSLGVYFLRNEVICTEELKNEELKMCSTAKSTIAIRIHRNDTFCHAELVSASLQNDKDSDFRRNDIYGHAELVSASRFYGKDSDFHRNDIYGHAELVSASLPNDKDSVPMVIGIHRNDVLYCTDNIVLTCHTASLHRNS